VVPRIVGAALAYAPAMWLMVGLTIALVGLAPGGVVASWVVLAACFVFGLLGAVLHIPTWLQGASPFERVPRLPAAQLTVVPLIVLTALAVGLALAGLVGLRRRDIG
jgi:ABC-2 type transport system permease protein